MIPYTETTKILGVTFDNDLKLKKQIDQRMQMEKYTKFKFKKFKTLKTKNYLFNTLILPQVLFSPTPIICRKICTKQNKIMQYKVLRDIFCISWINS